VKVKGVVLLQSDVLEATVKRSMQPRLVVLDPAQPILIRRYPHITDILLEQSATHMDGGKVTVTKVEVIGVELYLSQVFSLQSLQL